MTTSRGDGVTPRALDALAAHNWPGNIRELRYVVERAAMLCDSDSIDLGDLPVEFHANVPEEPVAEPAPAKKKASKA